MTGPEHPVALISAINLTKALFLQGEYGEVVEVYHQILAERRKIRRKILRHNKNINSLAPIFVDSGHLETVESLHRRSLIEGE